MSFEDVSQALNTLVKVVAEVYRGYYQYDMIETIFSGLIMGEPVLLIGTHASFKTSMSGFIGRLFDKPVAAIKRSFQTRDELEGFFEELGGAVGADGEKIMKNLADGAHVQYEQAGGVVKAAVELDLVKYPSAGSVADRTFRKPIDVFSVQVNDQMDPEDILGYAIDHPALLGMKPPHAVKAGRLAGADFICLDEIFGAPRLLSKIHHALNEKVVDTTIGPIEIKPLGWVLCTNPLNQFYQTNIKVVNVATLDRYALSAQCRPPSAQEILVMYERWKRAKLVKLAPVEIIYAARALLDEVKVPDEFAIFCLGLVSHLSRCYFSTSRGDRCMESKDPFEADKDCSLCIYKSYPCGVANVGKVRAMIRLHQAMKAHALLNMRRLADESDLAFALLHVLPHRLSWNNQEFLSEHGSPFAAARALINKYAELLASQYARLREIEELIKAQDANKALELRGKYLDAPIIRSVLDEVIEMMKEAAKKRGDQAALQALEPQLRLGEALKAIKGAL